MIVDKPEGLYRIDQRFKVGDYLHVEKRVVLRRELGALPVQGHEQ